MRTSGSRFWPWPWRAAWPASCFTTGTPPASSWETAGALFDRAADRRDRRQGSLKGPSAISILFPILAMGLPISDTAMAISAAGCVTCR